MPAVLYCANPLAPYAVDPHFGIEAAAVRAHGLRIALIDHDLLTGDAAAAVCRVPRGLGAVWYRGWMMTVSQYRDFAAALAARGATLVTSPAEYAAAHELPGWYPDFRELTPASAWLPVPPGTVVTTGQLSALSAQLRPGAGIVKDYVKSRKHDWLTACYLPALGDAATTTTIVNTFLELQDDSLAGGVVLREFEDFTGPQTRVWWMRGVPFAAGPHPDTPDETMANPDLAPLIATVSALGAPFVTTDIVRRADGAQRVIEVGDGQVSDWPAGVPVTVLADALGAA